VNLPRWLDFLYPPSCRLCHLPLRDGRALCSPCAKKLPRIKPPYCEQCGLPYDGNFPSHFTCPNCRDEPLPFDFAIAPLRARDEARDLIHAFKYERQLHLYRDLAALAAEAWQDPRLTDQTDPPWTLVPVPLHRRRKYWRWFNQAEELARALGEQLTLPVHSALERVRHTPHQTMLSRQERLANLKGAFRMSRRERKTRSLAGKPVILIDDVFTTGSTASECARILKSEGGVEKVVVLTVLRG
jgi:competence protein ComFC